MADAVHLKNAPISEAIIDVRVKLPGGFDCMRFETARDEMRAAYPVLKKRESVTRKFGLEGSGEALKEVGGPKVDGYFFLTEDEKSICQFRSDGFTFNKLRPYTKWDEIYPAAKKAWGVYCRIATPEEIARVAVRYINKMEVKLPILDFSTIYTSPPRVDERLPQQFLEFFSRVVIVDHPDRAAAVIQAIEPSPDPEKVILTLDIDAFALGEISEEAFDRVFHRLHNFKNDVFFNSLTPEFLETFK